MYRPTDITKIKFKYEAFDQQMFSLSLPPHQRQYVHHIYVFMKLPVIQFSADIRALRFFFQLFGQNIIL